ncbi:ATP-binding protein [Photobacterium phosphoreum]|uniref:ATP-binding protein n=1 Tax=Photobacterium phosphoreum TaxID=659 RepID=UPI000D1633F9|nr:ATP-binding protein [Photobacterium phosphoreum]PSU67061.1 ATP-binding protein [Photobacterium phosphoreum]PSW17362.1 ATP-binding protein [Photobacterium phosphoreum]
MSIEIGEVISIKGTNIIIELYEESNKETLFYNGEKFNGVSIQEFVLIRRGFKDIVARVQGEYLDERFKDEENNCYIRKVELSPIGYFQFDEFFEGIKHLPMIRDVAYLMSDTQVKSIFGKTDDSFIVGETLIEEIPVSLPWSKLFNTHMGVFGNTGSGKSNTLTNLYTTLFRNKRDSFGGKSHFIIIDFNGEYTNDQLIAKNEGKKVYELDTRNNDGDKFPLTNEIFWDEELFGILFKATENTQKPFLKRVVSGRNKYQQYTDSLQKYVQSTVKRALVSTSQKKEFVELIAEIAKLVGSQDLQQTVREMAWHSNQNTLYFPCRARPNFLDGGENNLTFRTHCEQQINGINIVDLSSFSELKLRINIQLLSDLISGYVQFDHIQPLLKRVEASLTALDRVFEISEEQPVEALLSVISLRKTNQEIKKVLPLLLAKFYYGMHKQKVLNQNPPQQTFHMIIDEAHNILSTQSNRESESWKDYRLELFEEIIKEGRKFGFFLTLSSQRPADISPTIMSQLHNFFIHRLVNDRDLTLLENTISSLDDISRQMIPNLSKGCAVITGTSFDIPMVVQFCEMPDGSRPDSDDIDIGTLWS